MPEQSAGRNQQPIFRATGSGWATGVAVTLVVHEHKLQDTNEGLDTRRARRARGFEGAEVSQIP